MQYVNRPAPLSAEERRKKEEERIRHEEEMRLRNNRLGLLLFQGSWILVFVCMLVVYWWMGYQPGWRPTPEQAPDPILPTVATIALIASAWLARRAWKTAETTEPQNEKYPFLGNWRIALLLGVVFFGIMITQFFAVPVGEEARFGTIYRVLIGYHAIHALAIGFLMFQVMRYGQAGRYHAENTWSVEAVTKLWYFVVVAWLMFYAVLYLPFLG